MSCDIYIFCEVKNKNSNIWEVNELNVFELSEFDKKYYKKEKTNKPFNRRNYSIFGFLGNVRNYNNIPSLSDNRGLPDDVSMKVKDYLLDGEIHSISFLTLSELLSFNYDNGEKEFLGTLFMSDLESLKTLGDPNDVRIVFGFDN